MIFAIVVGIPLGYLAASRTRPALDNGSVGGSLIGVAHPGLLPRVPAQVLFAVRTWAGSRPAAGRTRRIDATRVTGFFVLDGLLTREWDASGDALRHLCCRAIALAHHPVRDHLPDHPRLGARGARRGLRAHRRGQGPDRADHPRPARPAQRHAAGHHHDRSADRSPARRRGAHRDGLRLRRHRAFVAESISSRDYPVLQGLHPGHRGDLRRREPAGRHLLRRDRPEGEGADDHSPERKKREQRSTRLAERPPARTSRGVEPLAGGACRRLRRDPVVLIGAAILAIFIAVAIFAPWLAPYEPADHDRHRPGLASPPGTPSRAPQPASPLGADDKGRDFLSPPDRRAPGRR